MIGYMLNKMYARAYMQSVRTYNSRKIIMFDIHSHLLPAVDDGSKSMEMTRQMLSLYIKEGVTDIIATPHHSRHHGNTPPQELLSVYREVAKEAASLSPDLRIYLGSELFCSHSLIEELEEHEALTMNGTPYTLVEFHPAESFREIMTFMQKLQMHGYRPILAHAERCSCLLKKPVYTEDLIDMGCLIQVNAGSVTGDNGFSARRYVKKLLTYEMVHFLGTDAHNTGSRAPKMKKCADYIANKYGQEYANRLIEENPRRLLTV